MKIANFALLIVIALFLVGCSGVPPVYYYRIEYTPDNRDNNSVDLPYTIGVARFGTDALYESDRIVFRSSPYQAQFYNYHRWVSAPRKIVTEKTFKHYKSSALFKRVVRIPSSNKIDYILSGSIEAFEEWDDSSEWFGVVTISFTLQDAASKEIVWENLFTERTPAEKKEPVAVVKAISESLNRVVQASILQIYNHFRLSRNN